MDKNEDAKKNASLILEKWVASLQSRDRSNKSVPGNMDDLFEKLCKADVPFEVAHDEVLPKAIKAHLPSPGVARAVYKRCKDHTEHSEKEFVESWHNSIRDAATESFYSFYRIKAEEDQPKRYGGLTLKDHRQQQRYVESFETVNVSEIEAKIKELADMNIDDILNVLGYPDGETDSGTDQ